MTKKVTSKREKLFLSWLARPPVKSFKQPSFKDAGVDGYEFHDEIVKDYKIVKEVEHEDF